MQSGVEPRAGQLLAHIADQGVEKHTLRCRSLVISATATAEPAGVSHHAPVRGTVDRAMEPGGVDKRLQQHQRVAETGRPVTHDAPCAQPQHPRPEIVMPRPRQEQQPGVVRDQMKAPILAAEVPADPGVARPALQRCGRKHRQREPRPVEVRHIPQRLADLGQRAKIMMRLHQLPEPSLLLRLDKIDNHFG